MCPTSSPTVLVFIHRLPEFPGPSRPPGHFADVPSLSHVSCGALKSFIQLKITHYELSSEALQSVHTRHPWPLTSHRIRNNSQEIEEKNLSQGNKWQSIQKSFLFLFLFSLFFPFISGSRTNAFCFSCPFDFHSSEVRIKQSACAAGKRRQSEPLFALAH